MSNKLAHDVIDFATTYLADWQAKLDKTPYETLKELCCEIYGEETWKAVKFFGGPDPLAYFYKQKGQTAEFTNYIIDFFSEDSWVR